MHHIKRHTSELMLLLVALGLLGLVVSKYYYEHKSRLLLGGDAMMAVESFDAKDSEEIFSMIGVTQKTTYRTTEISARAKETEERSESKPTPILLKSIDMNYPIYGKLKLRNKVRPDPFAIYGADNDRGAAVSESVLVALGINPGDLFLIGNTTFIVTSVIDHEPDLLPQHQEIPRVIISDRSFDSLIKAGTYFEKPITLRKNLIFHPALPIENWKATFAAMNASSGWEVEIWKDHMPASLLNLNTKLLLIISGMVLLLAIIRYEMRKRRADA
ncbi:MAG: hypothetical protein SFW63_01165 [Alphaproteobacteria bacterium]|nr:hypothetical protein [Alphaproteobacteria bacterium]